MYFFSLLVSVIPEPLILESPFFFFFFFTENIDSCVYKKILAFFFRFFLYNSHCGVVNEAIILIGSKATPKSPKRHSPPNCTILGNWSFDNFTLANEPFAKAF